MAGHIITALGAGATITDSNQLVIGTTNALQNVVIPLKRNGINGWWWCFNRWEFNHY
jgi:hypothetical protein